MNPSARRKYIHPVICLKAQHCTSCGGMFWRAKVGYGREQISCLMLSPALLRKKF